MQTSEAEDEIMCDRENMKFEVDCKGESSNHRKCVR